MLATRIGHHELPRVDGLTILPAHGVAGLGAWVGMWSGLTHGPVFDGTVRARLDAGPAFTHLLALLGGEPVGCAAAFVGDGGGEVQHVVTLPAVRRSGIGTALTVAALRTVAARGAATAVLTSSPAGLRIYQRLGFRRVGWVRRYLWSPSAAEMPA